MRSVDYNPLLQAPPHVPLESIDSIPQANVPSWLITIPVWGTRCVGTFVNFVLPSIFAAVDHSKSTVRFLVHTDEPKQIQGAMQGLKVECREVPKAASPHHSLGAIHREAITTAKTGEIIAFLCADIVLSIECFAAAEQQFVLGKKLIMCAATRTFGGSPPIGALSKQLLAWTMENKHPVIEQCFWGTGHSMTPWAVYFKQGDNIVLRAFHLHPFAAVKDREILFKGVTVDFDLASSYSREQIHVVTDVNELSLAEISPLLGNRFLNRPLPMTADSVAAWATRQTVDVHRWFFRHHEIVIAGERGQCGEQPVCEQIIAKTIGKPPAPVARGA